MSAIAVDFLTCYHGLPVPQLPFSPFQKVTRQWEMVCPQNSAHALLVEGVLDPETIEAAWQSTLRDLGLGRVHVDDELGGYSHEIWSGDPPEPLVSHHATAPAIETFLQEQLNRPFPASPAMPYRPCALQGDQQCYLVLIYQQWVADSVSIRLLMREWFLRMFAPAKARRKLVDLPRLRFAAGLRIGSSPSRALRGALDAYGWIRNADQLTTFPSTKTADDNHIDLRMLRLEPAELDGLLMVTQAEGCTLSDLLMAALATALHAKLPHSGPMTLAITTSIDLRPYLGAGDLYETYGSLLAYWPVLCKLPCSSKLDLAQEIARQTRALKDPDRLAQMLLLPRVIAWWAARQGPGKLLAFHRAKAPIAASLANVNHNKTWMALHFPNPIRSYVRLASPSPAVPLSISTSTLGDTMDIILCANRGQTGNSATNLLDAFATALRSLVQSPKRM